MKHLLFLNLILCLLHLCSFGMEQTSTQIIAEAHEKLWLALKMRDFDTINTLITEGIVNINAEDEFKNTPLILIASDWKPLQIQTTRKALYDDPFLRKTRISKQISMVVRLIQAGATINATNQFNQTALTQAIANNNDELVLTLVEQKSYIPSHYKLEILKKALYYKTVYPSAAILTISPFIKPCVIKKIKTVFDIWDEKLSYLSLISKDTLAIILTYAYPECALSHETLKLYNPTDLVDVLPLYKLKILIAHGTLNFEDIYTAWQKKLEDITFCLAYLNTRAQEYLTESALEVFKIQTLETMTIYLQSNNKNH